MILTADRRLEGDWFDGVIPQNVALAETAHLETSYSFLLYRSRARDAVRIGHGSTVYIGGMFDVGPRGQVHIGKFSLINGAWFICDGKIEIGDHALIAWNVVFMDTYRMPIDPQARRRQLRKISTAKERRPLGNFPAKPIKIGRNVWIGFDCVVLPGVTIGEGSIVGARSVVASDVPPFTIVAGNPARVIRKIENDEVSTTH
jgi:acetyltransferase-like isoleucine patch superfamily enzyme